MIKDRVSRLAVKLDADWRKFVSAVTDGMETQHLLSRREPRTYTYGDAELRHGAAESDPARKRTKFDHRHERHLQLSRAKARRDGVQQAAEVIALGEHGDAEALGRSFDISAGVIERIRADFADRDYVIVSEAVDVVVQDEDDDGNLVPRTTMEMRERVRVSEPVGLDPVRVAREGTRSQLTDKQRQSKAEWSFRAGDHKDAEADLAAMEWATGCWPDEPSDACMSIGPGIASAVDGRQEDRTTEIPYPIVEPFELPDVTADGNDDWQMLAIESALEDFDVTEQTIRDAFVRGNLSPGRRRGREEARHRLRTALGDLWCAGINRNALAGKLGVHRDALYTLMGES